MANNDRNTRDGSTADEGGELAAARAAISELTLQLDAERQRRIELERAEHSLREQAARWAFAIESTGAGIVDWDIVNGTMEFSDHWLTITGYSREELPPTIESLTNLVHPDDLPVALADIEEVLAGRKATVLVPLGQLVTELASLNAAENTT